MKLLKLVLIIFSIYFIRRFIQMYRVMKNIHAEQMRAGAARESAEKMRPQGHVVNAEFKVIK